MKRLIYIIAGAAAFVVVMALIVTAWMWPILNEVETGVTPEYPEVQPRYYSTEPERIQTEVEAAMEALKRWEIVEVDSAAHRIDGERTTRLGFVGDVTVRVEPVTEFVSQVHVRSASRVGQADLGQNARNIDEFFHELDERLGAVKFDPSEAVEEREESSEQGLAGDG